MYSIFQDYSILQLQPSRKLTQEVKNMYKYNAFLKHWGYYDLATRQEWEMFGGLAKEKSNFLS